MLTIQTYPYEMKTVQLCNTCTSSFVFCFSLLYF